MHRTTQIYITVHKKFTTTGHREFKNGSNITKRVRQKQTKVHLFLPNFHGPPGGVQLLAHLPGLATPRKACGTGLRHVSRKKAHPAPFFNACRPFGFKSLRGSKREKSEWYMKHHSDYLARPEGFEPPSFGIGIHCDIQLRHGRKYIILNCTNHYTTKKGQCPHEKMRFYQFSLLRRSKVW